MMKLITGDSLYLLKTLADNSVDSIVTDPPYGLSFMGKKWDYDVPSVDIWKECYRVLKPGGHLLSFAGTRTQHRMAVNIEDAGFEIRDMIAWVYGSGFPKSLDISKALDKAAGAEREVVGSYTARGFSEISPTNDGRNQWAAGEVVDKVANITAPATESAKQWEGWGTALKPALEPITVARKPLIGTVAANVLTYGTGGINVDGCKVGNEPRTNTSASAIFPESQTLGRWPANLIHDGSEEVDTLLGSSARFFYCPKASKKDRDEGLEAFEYKELTAYGDYKGTPEHGPKQNVKARNHHPTVKPTELMRYLCRLVTPPNGLVLDPFMGSGSTGKAAKLEGFSFVGMDLDQQYVDIARARIEAV
jgi:DNA modification methylase